MAKASIDDTSWTWGDFVESSKQMMKEEAESGQQTRYAIAETPPDILFQEMFWDSYDKFVDAAAKKASFDSPAFWI